MLKDQAILYEDYSFFKYNCPICKKNTHLHHNCPNINYIPDKDRLVKRFNFSINQERKEFIRPCSKKKLNSLKKIRSIQIEAIKMFYKRKDEGNSSEFSLSEDDNETLNAKPKRMSSPINSNKPVSEKNFLKRPHAESFTEFAGNSHSQFLIEPPENENNVNII